MSSVDVEKIQQAAKRFIEDDLGVPVFESIPACGPGLREDPRWCISDAWDSPEGQALVDDLVAWLRAQIDEDERVARAADDGRLHIVEVSSGALEDHIARHDPARVLREVESKRRLMEIHQSWSALHPGETDVSFRVNSCVGCATYGDCDDPYVEDINDCPVLRALASAYGYDEERAAHPEG